MRSGSLRLRLMIGAATAISLSLLVAGMIFYYQFKKHVEGLALQELNLHFEQLVTSLSFSDAGELQTETELSDPRFSQQFGGLYWQVDIPGNDSLRSRSLWDESLTVPTPPETAEEDHAHDLAGPAGSTLLAVERLLTLEDPQGKMQRLVVTVGIDRTNISNAISSFANEIIIGLGALYAVLLASSLLQTAVGLRPLEAIRNGIEKIRSGSQHSLSGVFPKEVKPLVGELNSLIDAREDQLTRARHRAGNMAHGLKTPLTVLGSVADELARKGETRLSAEIVDATRQMRDTVERELMRARISSNTKTASAEILPVVTRVVSTLKRAGNTDDVIWNVDIPDGAQLNIEAGDLMEIVGNLLENAQKYARTRVSVSTSASALIVEDDGPGIPDNRLRDATQRGVRLDEKRPGSGLGLAIVQDLADAYGASLILGRSVLGGLSVTYAQQPQHSKTA